MSEIFGLDDNYDTNVEIEELQSERQTLITLFIDKSGSMYRFEETMVDCLEDFKSQIQGAKESDEMIVSKTMFGSDIVHGGYQLIDDMKTDYSVDGATRLYDCIVEGQKRLIDGNGNGYMETLQKNGIKTRGVIAIFSDGADNISDCSAQDARRAIEFLHSKEVIVAFVAFGDEAINVAGKIGIKPQNILKYDDKDVNENNLREVFQILSKSAISASKSAGAVNPDEGFFTV